VKTRRGPGKAESDRLGCSIAAVLKFPALHSVGPSSSRNTDSMDTRVVDHGDDKAQSHIVLCPVRSREISLIAGAVQHTVESGWEVGEAR